MQSVGQVRGVDDENYGWERRERGGGKSLLIGRLWTAKQLPKQRHVWYHSRWKKGHSPTAQNALMK